MLPLEPFRSRAFSLANVLTLFLYGALGFMMFLLPMNLIQVQGFTPTAAGAAWSRALCSSWLMGWEIATSESITIVVRR